MKPNPEFTLLYDGQCPICRREVARLRSRNRHARLGLQDIHDAEFDATRYRKTTAELMAEIHGLRPDGTLIKGMEAFRAAYAAVGLGWLLAPTRWPLLKPLFDGLYRIFARHRLRLGSLFGGPDCRNGKCRI